MTEEMKIRMAIAYDFDGTLTPGYMQENSFFPTLKMNPSTEFWHKSKRNGRKKRYGRNSCLHAPYAKRSKL